ncbi:FecCD family ABC transporter permease [Paenibacillus sinopodophylli]|uniref:FecCD family ABC transporter permease n=1 Tax=Paenibacillus sinopodophylli TaxID=1837342 RepID=UPI00110CE6AA|nr:iron ABC transporter permease [Paenibacillus sinopodophylli]
MLLQLAAKRFIVIMMFLAIANLVVLVLSVMWGEYAVPLNDIWRALFGYGRSEHQFVISELRLPRALVAFLVGCGLALSGAILQGITRNPMASPGVIGINAGAALMAVTIIIVLPAIPNAVLPFVAFLGALLAASITYVLAWRRGLSPLRLLLVGVGISAAANAYITFLLTTRQIEHVKQALLWMTGSAYGRSWEHFWSLLPWLLILFPTALVMSRKLDILQLGDELAIGLGARVERYRGVLLLISVSLAGAAVAMAGTIGFVGLMGPHIARQLVGNSSRKLLTASAFIGGMIVMLADLIGRTIFPPIEIPCGIITAIVGAPYLIYLLYRNRNKP